MEKVMQKWKSYGKHFQQNRLYMGILLLTAVCAYGYKVTNATIGIDDTPSLYYFEEGLIAIVGRWVLFLLNKVVSLAEFVPFVTDFAAVGYWCWQRSSGLHCFILYWERRFRRQAMLSSVPSFSPVP